MDPKNPGGGGWGGQPPQQAGYPAQQGGYDPQAYQQQQPWGQQPGQAGGGNPWGSPMFANAKNAGYQPTEEELTQAWYAHLFASLSNIVLCGSGMHLIGALIPFFTAKGQKGPFLLFHVNQAFVVQTALFAFNAVTAVVFYIIGIFTCGIGWFLHLFNVAAWMIAVIYPLVVGMRVKNGEWAEYMIAGEKMLNAKSPIFK